MSVNTFDRQTYFISDQNIGMSIGTRIKEARRDAKMTQKELCAKVGIKQGTLSELETGESAGTTLIASFAAALNINPLWLETGKGDKSPLASIYADANLTIAKEVGLTYSSDIQEVIKLMESTDERGRMKIKLAVMDALDLHNSHISRTRTLPFNEEEVHLVEQHRQSSKLGKSLIKTALDTAEKDDKKPHHRKAG